MQSLAMAERARLGGRAISRHGLGSMDRRGKQSGEPALSSTPPRLDSSLGSPTFIEAMFLGEVPGIVRRWWTARDLSPLRVPPEREASERSERELRSRAQVTSARAHRGLRG